MTATGSAGATTYTYNGDGQVASVADAAGKTSYTYDNVGRLATLADPATGVTATYSYNPDSQVSSVSYGSGNDTRSFAYDGQRRLASDTLKTSSGTVVASQAYGYDPDGHVTSEITAGLAGPASSTYTYDQAGRLASWDNGTATVSYGYDGNGNLTTDGAKTLTYDARDELTGDGTGSHTYTARGTPSSEPGPAGTLTVSFDAYGDQAVAGTGSYTYDAQGRLVAVTPATGTGPQLSYVGNTGAIASDGTAGYTWDPAGTSLFAAGAPGGGGGKLVLANSHGDVTGQYSPAGTSVPDSRAYDPWGTVTAASGTLAGMLGYQSALTDPAAGKDLMGARWYNPAAGGFTSADTIPQPPVPGPAAGNPFAYTGDDPLDATDPTGHCALCLGIAAALDPEVVIPALVIVGLALYAASHPITIPIAVNPFTSSAPADTASPAKAPPNTAPVPVIKPVVTTLPKTVAPVNKRTTVIPNDGPKKGITTHQPTGKPTSGPSGKGPSGSLSAKTPPNPVRILGPSPAPQNSIQDLISSDAGQNSIQQQIAALIAAGAGGTPAQPPTGNDGNCPPDPADLLNLTPDNSQDQQPASVGQSFTPDTRVLLPGGKTAAISSLKPGEKVTARDTKTGKNQAETVTAVEVHHDTDLYDLKVKTSHGTEVIHTTSSHLFYDPSLNKFLPASNLKPGTHLKTPDGQSAVVVGGSVPAVHDGWMWDLTVPGNNDHDFYVMAAQGRGVPVLVHNSNGACGVDPALIQKLQESGVKFTPGNVVAAGENADGQVVFLETGNSRAGLTHIIEQHGGQFAQMGIPEEQVPDFVVTAATEGKMVGIQGTRPIFEVEFEGQTRRVAVTVGSNGFVVGANPVGS